MKTSIALTLLCFAVTGCNFGGSSPQANQQGNQPGATSAPDQGTPVGLGDGWTTDKDSNGDFADLTVSKMTPSERDRVRSEVSKNNVTWVNSKSGYTLYKITGSDRFEKSAFILPKVLVIGSVDGGRASLRDLPDGRVALTVPIALVDGSQRDLPYATTRIRIPDAMFLDDVKRATIQKELTDGSRGDKVRHFHRITGIRCTT